MRKDVAHRFLLANRLAKRAKDGEKQHAYTLAYGEHFRDAMRQWCHDRHKLAHDYVSNPEPECLPIVARLRPAIESIDWRPENPNLFAQMRAIGYTPDPSIEPGTPEWNGQTMSALDRLWPILDTLADRQARRLMAE